MISDDYKYFEDEMEALAEDRLRLLDALGLTEREWACRGGGFFGEFQRPSTHTDDSDDEEEEIAAVVALQPPPLPVEALPPPLPPEASIALFGSVAAQSPPMIWTDEQKEALDQIDRWCEDWGWDSGPSFFKLTGPAGVGKSTLMREVVNRYGSMALTAMTGKAALRLSQLAQRESTTLHKVLYYPPKPGEAVHFTKLREPTSARVAVDESSMATPAVFGDLKRWGPRKILLVGDPYQLPPVITGEDRLKGGDDYSVFAEKGIADGYELKTVMRSVGGVLRAATKVRTTGEICRESDFDGDDGYEYRISKTPLDDAVSEYLADRDDHLLITWKNKNRMMANREIRSRLGLEGPLPDIGEPVLIRRNGSGFLNGEIVECGGFEDGPTLGARVKRDGTVIIGLPTLWMHAAGGKVLVAVQGGPVDKGGEWFDGGMPWIEDWRAYHTDLNQMNLNEPLPITWGYCVTAHCAQGSEARRSTVFLCRGDYGNPHFRKLTTLPSGEQVPFSARWAYTSMTRAKKLSTMIVGRV